MSRLRFRSLSQIFLLGAVLISVPLLAGSVLSFFYIERLSEENRGLVVRSLEIGRETEKLTDHVQELGRTARQYLVVEDDELYSLYRQRHYRFIDTLEWIEVLVEHQEARRLVDEIRSVGESAFARLRSMSDTSDGQLGKEQFDKLVALSDNLRFLSNTSIRERLDAAAQRVKAARVALYWTWGVSSVFILAFIGIFIWFIARPIRSIDAHIRRLGQGEFEGPIEIRGPADISRLGDRLDWLRSRLGEVDQIKERFFREMSHQLKTPLASIREGVDLLAEESGSIDVDRQKVVREILQKNSIELQRMLDNMLNFSAWRADPGRLHMEEFRVKPLVESIAQRFRALLLSRDLTLDVQCAGDLSVVMDREKCRVILDNLLSNAVKFSPDQGKIGVTVSGDQSTVFLGVSDEGPGIPVGERDRIFELFYLGHRPENSRIRGTGIGLFLVRAYVEAHGGRIDVDSTRGIGAHFRVAIPRG